MAEHKLKTWPNHFAAVRDGRKRFEWRRDDRGFEVGDVLVLQEWDPTKRLYVFSEFAVGRINSVRVRVTYILRGGFDIPHGYVVMSIDPETP